MKTLNATLAQLSVELEKLNIKELNTFFEQSGSANREFGASCAVNTDETKPSPNLRTSCAAAL